MKRFFIGLLAVSSFSLMCESSDHEGDLSVLKEKAIPVYVIVQGALVDIYTAGKSYGEMVVLFGKKQISNVYNTVSKGREGVTDAVQPYCDRVQKQYSKFVERANDYCKKGKQLFIVQYKQLVNRSKQMCVCMSNMLARRVSDDDTGSLLEE